MVSKLGIEDRLKAHAGIRDGLLTVVLVVRVGRLVGLLVDVVSGKVDNAEEGKVAKLGQFMNVMIDGHAPEKSKGGEATRRGARLTWIQRR